MDRISMDIWHTQHGNVMAFPVHMYHPQRSTQHPQAQHHLPAQTDDYLAARMQQTIAHTYKCARFEPDGGTDLDIRHLT